MSNNSVCKVEDLIKNLKKVRKRHGNIPLVWKDHRGLIQPFDDQFMATPVVFIEARKTLCGKTMVMAHEARYEKEQEWVSAGGGLPFKNGQRNRVSNKPIPVLLLQDTYRNSSWETVLDPKTMFLPSLKTAMNRNMDSAKKSGEFVPLQHDEMDEML